MVCLRSFPAVLVGPVAFVALASLGCSPGAPGSADGMTTTSAGGSSDSSSSEESGVSGGSEESSGTGEPDPTDTTTDAGTDTGDPDFVPPDTDTGDPASCDLLEQSCPEGEKCVPILGSGGQTQCVPITGEGSLGQACTTAGGQDDCDGEHVCVDGQDGDGEGYCAPLCVDSPNGPSCDEGMFCNMAGLCLGDRCNPLEPDPCANGWPCLGRVGNGGARCSYIEGASYGDVPIGEVCAEATDCVEGSACTNAMAVPDCAGELCCTAWCDPADPDSCVDQIGTMCTVGGMGMAAFGRCLL